MILEKNAMYENSYESKIEMVILTVLKSVFILYFKYFILYFKYFILYFKYFILFR